MKSKLTQRLLSAVLVLLSLSGYAKANAIFESFEDNSLPHYISASATSKIGLSDEVSQHGKQSMLWQWQGRNSYIDIDLTTLGSSADKENQQLVKNLNAWIYSTGENSDLIISWGSRAAVENDSPEHQVDYKLNFSGWRSLWLLLENDGQLIPQTSDKFELLRIHSKAAKGTISIDLLAVGEEDIFPFGRLGSFQQPWVENDVTNRHNYPWVATQYQASNDALALMGKNLTSLSVIEDRMTKMFNDSSMVRWDKAKKYYKAYAKQAKKIAGNHPHISTHLVDRTYRAEGYEGVNHNQLQYTLLEIASRFTKAQGKKKRGLLLKQYIDLVNLMHNKGFAEGSAQMNLVFAAKNSKPYIYSLYLMHEHLAEPLLRRELAAIRWLTGFNNIHNPKAKRVDADKMLGDVMSMLMAAYLTPATNQQEKIAKLNDYFAISRLIEHSMQPMGEALYRLGEKSIVMPDHSVFHHGQAMQFTYGYSVVQNYGKYYYLFKDTIAALNDSVIDHLVDYYPKYFVRNQLQAPTVGNRSLNTSGGSGFVKFLNYAAAADNVKALSWLRYYLETSQIDNKQIFNVNIENINSPMTIAATAATGNYYQPFSAMSLHHTGSNLVALRSMNRIVPSPEMFGTPARINSANVYGDMQGYGFLQLMTQKPNGSYYQPILSEDGWDWSMYPGATTARLTNDELLDDLYQKFKHPEKTLSGGLSHFNDKGMHYLELYGPKNGLLEAIKGNKSWFFFDDLIVCLGSDLSFKHDSAAMVTNLFQVGKHGAKDEMRYQVLSAKEQVVTNHYAEQQLPDADYTLTDPNGNQYFVPKGQNIKLSAMEQNSNKPSKREKYAPNTGFFHKAWLDHGVNPESAQYEYAIKLTGQGEKASFPTTKPYQVLQKNNEAHIVKHNASNTWGYVALKGGKPFNHGPVFMTEKPVMIMVAKEHNTSLLKLTIADPETNVPAVGKPEPNHMITSTTSQDQFDGKITHKVTINGRFSDVSCNNCAENFTSRIVGERTEITATSVYGQSMDFILQNVIAANR